MSPILLLFSMARCISGTGLVVGWRGMAVGLSKLQTSPWSRSPHQWCLSLPASRRGSAQGEGTLGPDDELGPVTSSVDEGPLLGVQFRAGHEDVYLAVGVGQHVLAGYEQKVVKAVPQSIVLDRSSSTGI